MKKAIAALCCAAVLLLAACAPDNIVTPVEETQAPVEQPAQSTEQPTEEAAPAASPQEAAEETAQMTDSERYLSQKKQNSGVRPQADIDGLGFVDFKTPQLNGRTVHIYKADRNAFTAGELNETQWFAALEKEYGVKANVTLRSKSTLYASQLIAQKAGLPLDVIGMDAEDCAAALSLCAGMTEEVRAEDNSVFSARIFNRTGGKMFAPVGNCRVLWYNKALTGDNDPFRAFLSNSWTTDSLSQFCAALKPSGRLLECNQWLPFGSAGGAQASGLTDAGFALALTEDAVRDTFETFGVVFQNANAVATGDYRFEKGNTLFCFADAPSAKDISCGWVPIPRCGEDGACVGADCGAALGVSRSVREEDREAIVSLILLWNARYSESRVDDLLHIRKLSSSETDAYLRFCEQQGKMLLADAVIAASFTADTMPPQIYGDDETVYREFETAFTRNDQLNDRYYEDIVRR